MFSNWNKLIRRPRANLHGGSVKNPMDLFSIPTDYSKIYAIRRMCSNILLVDDYIIGVRVRRSNEKKTDQ